MMPLKTKKFSKRGKTIYSKTRIKSTKKQPKVKNYFPIYAKHKYDILQLDLVKFSNIK